MAFSSAVFVQANVSVLHSKIQKYSPTESAKVYDKAVNRKANVHFNPRQTLDFLTNSLSNAELTYEVKRRIVRQYLDVSNSRAEMYIFLPLESFTRKSGAPCIKLASEDHH